MAEWLIPDPAYVKKYTLCIFSFLLLLPLSGCASLKNQPGQQKRDVAQLTPLQSPEKEKEIEEIPPEPPKPAREIPIHKSNKGKPYRAKGVIYLPLLTSRGYEEKGIASWYGPSFHGHKTSCGAAFDMHKITAAHKLLPMYAKVNVTNLENGKTITLTINDRGPFVPGRVLDLSYAAAKRLGMINKGLARVFIRTSGPLPGQKKNDMIGEFFVHIGSFETKEAAAPLLEDMKSLKYKQSILKVIKSDRGDEICWRVELGPYKSMSAANKAHSWVVKDYPSAFVVAKE
ncbi:MAG: septal ring lytic transglycosylase RlpA family protein [Syntrophales bacterium]|nr:septal ring lytic transglycosylase RlpA family protein [Syntrophales bacterium]